MLRALEDDKQARKLHAETHPIIGPVAAQPLPSERPPPPPPGPEDEGGESEEMGEGEDEDL